VERVPRGGLGPHVGEEGLERVQPPLTDLDPAAAVVGVLRKVRVGAARLHHAPTAVLRAVRLAVGRGEWSAAHGAVPLSVLLTFRQPRLRRTARSSVRVGNGRRFSRLYRSAAFRNSSSSAAYWTSRVTGSRPGFWRPPFKHRSTSSNSPPAATSSRRRSATSWWRDFAPARRVSGVPWCGAGRATGCAGAAVAVRPCPCGGSSRRTSASSSGGAFP